MTGKREIRRPGIRAVPDANGDAVLTLWRDWRYLEYQNSGGPGATETIVRNLTPGRYVYEVYHYGHVWGSDVAEECINVSVQ